MARPDRMSAQLAAVRRRTDRPIAVNLLLPFVRPGHARPAAEADVVVTFWGRPRRFSDKPWLHQAGSGDEARAAHAAGADAAVCGTRFVMSEESGAAPGHKRRLVGGSATVLTELFGVGWAGAHRVLPNGATRRWLGRDRRGRRSSAG